MAKRACECKTFRVNITKQVDGGKPIGILSKAVSKFLNATPFPSESLDNLADAM